MVNSSAIRKRITNPEIHAGRRVFNAIRFLKDPDGSSVAEIKKWLSTRQQVLPNDELSAFIKASVKSGTLEKNGIKYKIVEKLKKKSVVESIKNQKRARGIQHELTPMKRKRLETNKTNAAVTKEKKKIVGKNMKHLERAADTAKNKLLPVKHKRLEISDSNTVAGKIKQLVGKIPKRQKTVKDTENETTPKKRKRRDPAKVDIAADNLDLPENVTQTGQLIDKIPKRQKAVKDTKNETTPKKRKRRDPAKVDIVADNLDLPENVTQSVDSIMQREEVKSQLQEEKSSPIIDSTVQSGSRDVVEDVFT